MDLQFVAKTQLKLDVLSVSPGVVSSNNQVGNQVYKLLRFKSEQVTRSLTVLVMLCLSPSDVSPRIR